MLLRYNEGVCQLEISVFKTKTISNKDKQDYNTSLKRIMGAWAFFEKEPEQIKREKWVGHYSKLIENHIILTNRLELKSGDPEMLEGFKDVE